MPHVSLKSATWMILFVSLGGNIQGREKPTSSNVEYGRADEVLLLLDFYAPTEIREERPLIIWVHGGAWRSGSK